MAEHEHGSMEVKVQEKNFAGFVHFLSYVCIFILFVLIFLAVFNS